MHYIAIVVNVLFCAAIFCAAIYLLRRIQSPVAWRVGKILGLCFLLIPLNALRPQLVNSSSAVYYSSILPVVGKWGSVLCGLILGLLIVRLLMAHWRDIWKYIVVMLLVLTPFLWLTMSQSFWIIGRYVLESPSSSIFESNPSVRPVEIPKLAQGGARRILWLIFDEMDQRLAFEERPQDIQIPSFDRLRQTSIVATQALPPAGNTLASLPSLLSGRVVDSAKPVDSSELLLQYADGTNARWSRQDNIFKKMQSRGYKTALVGWYHPYWRVLGKNLDDSRTFAGTGDHPKFSTGGIWGNVKSEWLGLLPTMNRQSFIHVMQEMQENTIRLAASLEYGLVFSHLPGLHTPYVYDRHNDRYTLFRDNVTGYFDHMVLADYTFGRIRSEMELKGLWDDTLVIVSADHWWRKSATYDGKVDHRVPFIVKMPGQKNGIVYDKPIQTVVTYSFLLAVLNGEVKTAEEATQWMERLSDSKK